MVKAIRGVLVQADESIMAIIKKIDQDRPRDNFIIDDLDDETCLVKVDKLAELERLVKEHIDKHVPKLEESDDGRGGD